MLNESTRSPSYSFSSPCSLDVIASSAFRAVTFSTTVVLAILSPVAVAGNALIMAAVWRNQSLRTPTYILLCGLAFTDFCTGLVTQPVHVVAELICLKNSQSAKKHPSMYARTAGKVFGTYFSSLTLILVALMSIERWLHMSRRSLLTVRRCCIVVSSVCVLLVPLVSISVMINNIHKPIAFTLLIVCSLTTSIAYFKVYRIIRRHQLQIQASESSENCSQPAINVAKYKKSVFTVLYIVTVFYITYVPSVITFGLSMFLYHHSALEWVNKISVTFLFLSSSVNPLIYLWRMNDIRNEVKHLMKQLLCKEI